VSRISIRCNLKQADFLAIKPWEKVKRFDRIATVLEHEPDHKFFLNLPQREYMPLAFSYFLRNFKTWDILVRNRISFICFI
jgi:hypothetical protein